MCVCVCVFVYIHTHSVEQERLRKTDLCIAHPPIYDGHTKFKNKALQSKSIDLEALYGVDVGFGLIWGKEGGRGREISGWYGVDVGLGRRGREIDGWGESGVERERDKRWVGILSRQKIKEGERVNLVFL